MSYLCKDVSVTQCQYMIKLTLPNISVNKDQLNSGMNPIQDRTGQT